MLVLLSVSSHVTTNNLDMNQRKLSLASISVSNRLSLGVFFRNPHERQLTQNTTPHLIEFVPMMNEHEKKIIPKISLCIYPTEWIHFSMCKAINKVQRVN